MLRTAVVIIMCLVGCLNAFPGSLVEPETRIVEPADSMKVEAEISARDSVGVPGEDPEIWASGLRHIVTHPEAADSVDIVTSGHKSFWRASAEVVGFNLGLWAVDRYIRKADYAYISWKTIKENLKAGFEWDNDYLSTNMFMHPYNGSLYFNAGRSNGYNFWQSSLFTLGGSAMWELFMENEHPSINDIIATPVGGAAVGEVLYRTSDLIIDDRTWGWNRAGREIAAFLVNPMRGFTRLVTGRAWKRGATSGRQFGIPPISVEVSLGGRSLIQWDNDEGSQMGAMLRLRIEYGDRFADRTRQPYDWFSFLTELQMLKGQPTLNRMEVVGRLLSTSLIDKPKCKMSIGMYQHFDYFDTDSIRPLQKGDLLCGVPYKLGIPASVGAGLMFRMAPVRNWSLDATLHLNGVVLAGVLTDFFRHRHRNYNWGSGFSIKAGLSWSLANHKVSVDISNQFFGLFTWGGYKSNYAWEPDPASSPSNVLGDKSRANFNHFDAQINFKVWQRLYLSGGIDLYERNTYYRNTTVTLKGKTARNPHVRSRQIGLRLLLTYRF